MKKEARNVDPIPDEFSSYEEAADFWDTHDTTDYPEAFEDPPVELQVDLRERHYEVEIEENVFKVLREKARNSGVSVGNLVNDLLRQQLAISS